MTPLSNTPAETKPAEFSLLTRSTFWQLLSDPLKFLNPRHWTNNPAKINVNPSHFFRNPAEISYDLERND